MNRPSPPFVLIDMDGTLLHLGWAHPEVDAARDELVRLARELRIAPPHGMLIPTLAAAGRQRPDITRALDRVEATAARHAARRAGAERLLRAIAHLPLALVTSNGRPCAAAALAASGLDNYLPAFDAQVTRDDVHHLKPDPEPLARALDLLTAHHGPPGAVVMIGDAATDVTAARALATARALPTRALAITGGVSTPRALARAGADAVVDTLEDLLPLLLPQDNASA